MDAAPIPPSIPFHLAQAYSAGRPVLVSSPLAPPTTAATPVHDIARRAVLTSIADRVDLSLHSPPAEAMRDRARDLVAARVVQGVDFLAQGVSPAPDAISMYRHPADKNAAATGVDAGRIIDVEG